MNRNKIAITHQERLAYVYIRQSSMRQVEEHLESQDLQYQLVKRAHKLGWKESQIRVVDEDLGKSGVSSQERMGFQHLVAAVGLNQVGIILVTDVSRLARNCSDWYQLLDLSSVWHCLISDASGVYDPRCYDDRLLLGLKGTFSEVQWHQMRSQLTAALFNKARRGELAIRLPVGYDRMEDGCVVKTPDREVQQAIELIFSQFERLGTARAVLYYFRDNGLLAPRKQHTGANRGMIYWQRPAYPAIYHILKHPAYAGAYSYGKHHNTRLPGSAGKTVVRRLPLEEWPVLIQDAFPGYITWEQYMKNQEQLRQNAQSVFQSKGAPRRGAALLQGLVVCARCGRRMNVVYGRSAGYACRRAHHAFGEPNCQYFTASPIDQAVSQVVLQAVEPARLEAAIAALEHIEAERQRVVALWDSRIERSRYEADLACKRYQSVDPQNRLVAAELEKAWEEKLVALQSLEQEYRQAQEQQIAPLSEADREMIHNLAADLPALWHAETTTNVDRKRLIRCLIQDITLDSFSDPTTSQVHICWHTGATTSIQAPRPRPGRRLNHELLDRIRLLAQDHTDEQIADILHGEGLTTYTGLPWTRRRVFYTRRKNRIPTYCANRVRSSSPRGDGLFPVREAARQLGVSHSMITNIWFKRGFLLGYQRRPGSPIWVRLNEHDRLRLDGSIPLQDNLVPYSQACTKLQLTQDQLFRALQSEELLAIRIRVGKLWRWFIAAPSVFSSLIHETL